MVFKRGVFEMQKQRTKNCKYPSYGSGAIDQNVVPKGGGGRMYSEGLLRKPYKYMAKMDDSRHPSVPSTVFRCRSDRNNFGELLGHFEIKNCETHYRGEELLFL